MFSSTSFTSATASSSATSSVLLISSSDGAGQRPGPTLALPSASSTGIPCNAGPCSPPPATLYLYTFLSTLIILLLVSAAIILRSVVLRRRQQIAIANGTWVPPASRREHTHVHRPKPQMFDLYIAEGAKEENQEWGSMKPFSASDITESSKTPVVVSPPAAVPYIHIRQVVREEMRSMWRLQNPLRPPQSAPPPPDVELTSPNPASSSPSRVRIATLVAMPSQGTDTEAEELPYLEFGILDADIVDHGRMSTQSEEGGAIEREHVESKV